MVKRVKAPAEHHLLVNGQTLVSQFGGETLSKFAVEKLLEHKLTSRNFKAGLDFSDNYRARTGRTKLVNLIAKYVQREYPHYTNDSDGILSNNFVAKHYYSNEQLNVVTMYDKAVLRYLRRINKALVAHNIPITVNFLEHNTESGDKIEITIGARTSGTRSTLHYYRLLCFVPEILAFFRNLSRKATFRDEHAKAVARSKFSGWVGITTPQRNAANSRSNENAAHGAANPRGGQRVNRRDDPNSSRAELDGSVNSAPAVGRAPTRAGRPAG
jgi:hypothetical protein